MRKVAACDASVRILADSNSLKAPLLSFVPVKVLAVCGETIVEVSSSSSPQSLIP